MANKWTEVARKGRPKLEKETAVESPFAFLREFKTVECSDSVYHEWKTCRKFHNVADRRRNPYETNYAVEECLNQTEKNYHPSVYRTSMCAYKGCMYGSACAFAHYPDQIRDGSSYENLLDEKEKKPQLTLGSHIPFEFAAPTQPATSSLTDFFWSEIFPQSKRVDRFMECSHFQMFLMKNPVFFSYLKDVALSYMCIIQKHRLSWKEAGAPKNGLLISGTNENVEITEACICSVMDEPPVELVSTLSCQTLGNRITTKLILLFEQKGGEKILESLCSKTAYVRIKPPAEVRIFAVIDPKNKGLAEAATQDVLTQIKFWAKSNGYDEFKDCSICMCPFNKDQGILCSNAHFICSEVGEANGCIEQFVASQKPVLQAQGGKLQCPICHVEIFTQHIASVVTKATWNDIEKTILEIKVQLETINLKQAFDERLESEVLKLIQSYGSAEKTLKVRAQLLAAKATDEILNLRCPHCRVVYADFDGCMALQCASCRGHFCGYCHKGTLSSTGAHDHVRECDMNLTHNASYYANIDQIKEGQRRYRIKELKKFLRNSKKLEQNATIIELTTDLKQLGIDPAALFDFGNLQGEG